MVNTKQFNQTIILIVLLTITIFLTIAYILTNSHMQTLKKEKYTDISYNIKSKLDTLIENKKQLNTFIALALAQNSTIIKALEQNNKELIDMEYLSNIINKQSSYTTVWYQILDKNGNSFYRSWTEKSGDSLLEIRPEVHKMIKQPQIISTISTGKFTMSFKSMVPIFDNNKNYLGSFEVVSHFDSIQTKLLQEDGAFSIYIVDKDYKTQITKPVSHLFIDNYYITLTTENKKVLNTLIDCGIENFLAIEKDYIIDNNKQYLVTPYIIPDINGNLMGYALSFKPLKTISIDQAIYLKNNVAHLMFVLVLLTVLVGYYIINRKHQKYIMLQHSKHQQDIIKSTKFQTIGEMAAGITHEINTPLTYIKGTLEMSKLDIEKLPKSKVKDRLEEDFEVFYNGINRIGIIVESMKEMAQSSISKKEKFNLYTTLIIVLRMIHHKSKQIAPIYLNGELFTLEDSDINKEKYFSNIHVQRIEQVWTIILNNALDELLKVQEYEQRRVDITLESSDNKFIIKFIDNAGGIPQKILSKIFEPFVSTKQSSGIGIGLNVAKKIIEEHDALISVENTEDGACFTVVLEQLS